MITLQDFINHKGGRILAAELGVDENTIYMWKAKKQAPRPHTAKKLIDMTAGLLTWDGIYGPYLEHNNETQLELPVE